MTLFNSLVLGGTVLMLGKMAVAQEISKLEQIKQLAGCYVVDYSFSETEVLDPNYVLDARVYDASQFLVKELIRVVDSDASSVRLQHFMQADSHSGDPVIRMRHHAEVWRKAPEFRYKYLGRFAGNDRWDVENLSDPDQWLREITNLDDGLRYQCLGKWVDHTYPRFQCSAFAPIPGRETRDMGRQDYNTLDRTAKIDFYDSAWLERQNNIKTQFDAGATNRLVREVGKIWSVRVAEEQCASVAAWADERQAFWDILAGVWSEFYATAQPLYENKIIDGSTRGQKISKLMNQYYETVQSNEEHARFVRAELRRIIEMHRE